MKTKMKIKTMKRKKEEKTRNSQKLKHGGRADL